MKAFFANLMAKIVAFFDPRVDRFRKVPIAKGKEAREKAQEKLEHDFEKRLKDAIKEEHKNFTPQSEKDLVDIIRRTPREALSIKDRNLISGAMSFKSRTAAVVMMPRDDIIFLHEKDSLGPLALDKLYKTGETVFPVLNGADKVCGIIRTDKLDLLHIGKNEPVAKLMEHNVAFARTDYTLEELLAVFLRNHTDYVLIIDSNEKLLGYAELDTLIAVLFNREIKDDFDNDASSFAVARRERD
jgi:CBS domain containing-hemolysin-like protein